MSKILGSILACFPHGGIYMPKMHWISLRELLGIWAKSASLRELSELIGREKARSLGMVLLKE